MNLPLSQKKIQVSQQNMNFGPEIQCPVGRSPSNKRASSEKMINKESITLETEPQVFVSF
jgi:topoisomerase IA-like protein